ncbi:hypothetical protein KCV07_g8883, partial [Aureobasidium melanogenum]
MVPSFLSNNTFVYDSQSPCDTLQGTLAQAQCSTWRGGFFDHNDSTSYEAASNMSASEFDVSDTFVNATSAIWSTDMFHFTSNISSKVAFGIRRAANIDFYHSQHILGLGASSTLLSTLKEAGIIASRSWSVYWGNSGAPDTQKNGTFVLGGYDSTKVTGQNYSFPLTYDSSCPSGLVVLIAGLSLIFPNGTTANLFQSAASSLRACIEPDYPVLITLPRDPYYDNLQLAAGIPDYSDYRSPGINYEGVTYPSDYHLDFGMSISLQSGPSISIANSQVAQPDATILSDGLINYTSTLNEVNIIPLYNQTENDMVQLGRQFLSGAYLMVNQDTGIFTLWEAIYSPDEDLVAIDAQGQVFSPTCASTTSNNTTSGSTGSASPTPTPKTSTGTIVGAVVGGIAGVGLLVGLGIFLWKRSRKNKAISAAGSGAYFHDKDEKAIPLYDYSAAKMNDPAYELRGNPVNEMSGQHSPKEKSKSPTTKSGVHELGDSY